MRVKFLLCFSVFSILWAHGTPGFAQYRPPYNYRLSDRLPRAPEPSEHLQYLSPRCSTMSEGIRTSAVRGVSNETAAALQKEYRRECADDDRQAQEKLYASQAEAKAARMAVVKRETLSREQAAAKQQMCDESKRIIFVKKKRADLTEGEQRDLQRFEQNYKERCF